MKNQVKSYFQEVRRETKKVSWPTKKEATRYTLIVIGISVAVAALLGGFDYILTTILRTFAL